MGMMARGTSRFFDAHRCRLVLVMALVGAAEISSTAHAQLPETVIASLSPARRTRVRLQNGEELSGRIASVTTDTLTLNVIDYLNAQRATLVPHRIPTDVLTHLWVADGTRWKKGAMIGGAVGAGFALALALVYGGGGDSPDCRGACLVGFTAAGGGVGAVTGAAIGLFFLRWRLVY